jgi:lysophospholipase L1-like esterase
MKKINCILGILCCVAVSGKLQAQFTYKIKADSIRLYNDSCNAELIIENSTKNISGFLFNTGKGRTQFRQEADPTIADYIKNITQGQINQWNAAFSWGDHHGLYQPLENQRLSTGNSPVFSSQLLTGASIQFVNGANNIIIDGSDPGTWRSHYLKFRSQTTDKGVGLQTIPGGTGNNVPYEFDFCTVPDGSAAFMLLGDGPRQVHTIASLGTAGTAWPIAFEVNAGTDPTDHQYDVIRLLTDRSIQFPQLGAGYLVTDATGKVSVEDTGKWQPAGNYILNTTTQQANSNINISGRALIGQNIRINESTRNNPIAIVQDATALSSMLVEKSLGAVTLKPGEEAAPALTFFSFTGPYTQKDAVKANLNMFRINARPYLTGINGYSPFDVANFGAYSGDTMTATSQPTYWRWSTTPKNSVTPSNLMYFDFRGALSIGGNSLPALDTISRLLVLNGNASFVHGASVGDSLKIPADTIAQQVGSIAMLPGDTIVYQKNAGKWVPLNQSYIYRLNFTNSKTFYNNLVFRAPLSIACEGNSLTWGQCTGWPVQTFNGITQSRAPHPFPETLQSILSKIIPNTVTVTNRGYPGDQSSQVISRWANAPYADVVFIECGRNDQNANVFLSAYQNNLITLITRRLLQGSYVVLYSFATTSSTAASSNKDNAYKAVAYDVARRYGIPILDASEVLGYRDNFTGSDGVHLTDSSYQELAASAASLLLRYENNNALKVAPGDRLTAWNSPFRANATLSSDAQSEHGKSVYVGTGNIYVPLYLKTAARMYIKVIGNSGVNRQMTLFYGNGQAGIGKDSIQLTINSDGVQKLYLWDLPAGERLVWGTNYSNTASFKIDEIGFEESPASVSKSLKKLADADYTVTASDDIIILPAITANRTLILPAAATNPGRTLRLFNLQQSTVFSWQYSVAVLLNSGNTVTGVGAGNNVVLISDGANWRLFSSNTSN